MTSIGAAYDSPRNTRVVLIVAFLLVLGFGLWGLISPDVMTAVSVGMVDFVLDSVGWLYLALCSGFVILGGLLAFGRYGRVRLGPDDSRPEFSTASWLAMLFAGGMGAGLVFWGVAEPVSHFAHPPGNVVGSTPEAARLSMMLTNLHWGLHTWSIYAVCALVLAYFMFRRGLPGLISTPIRATLPASRPTRLLGFTSDIIAATFAVVFGLAGSLVMGVLQVRAGVTEVFGIAPTTAVSVVILGVLAVAFMLSASTGLSKGIQILSNHINMVLVILLLLVVSVFGPTAYIMDAFVNSIGDYIAALPRPIRSASCPTKTQPTPTTLDPHLSHLVGRLGPLRGHLHRPHQPRPDHPPILHRRHPDPIPVLGLLVRRPGGHQHLDRAQRGWRPRGAGERGRGHRTLCLSGLHALRHPARFHGLVAGVHLLSDQRRLRHLCHQHDDLRGRTEPQDQPQAGLGGRDHPAHPGDPALG